MIYLYITTLITYVSETASPETFSSTDATRDVANFTGVENYSTATTLLPLTRKQPGRTSTVLTFA